jgi:hypothetical protein
MEIVRFIGFQKLNVSEILQLIGNMTIFVAIHLGKPQGMMEYSRTHYSIIPLFHHSNCGAERS